MNEGRSAPDAYGGSDEDFGDFVRAMFTHHYDQALAENLEKFEREVIGDLSNFKPPGFLGGASGDEQDAAPE